MKYKCDQIIKNLPGPPAQFFIMENYSVTHNEDIASWKSGKNLCDGSHPPWRKGGDEIISNILGHIVMDRMNGNLLEDTMSEQVEYQRSFSGRFFVKRIFKTNFYIF